MLQRWSHLGPIPILSIHMLLLRLCYPQTSNLFPSRSLMPARTFTTSISLCAFEPQTTSLPTQNGWPGAWSASPPTGGISPYHSLSRPFWSDPSPGQAWVCPFFLHWAVQNPPYSHWQRLTEGCWGNCGGCLEVKKLKLCVRVVSTQAEMARSLYRCLTQSLKVGCFRKGTLLDKEDLCSCGRRWRSWQLEAVCWLTPCSKAATFSEGESGWCPATPRKIPSVFQQVNKQYVEKAMAPHSSTLAWKIPWTEEAGGLQSMGSRKVGHNWVTSLSLFTLMHWRRKWQPTPVFLPGESQGWASLVGCRLWGCTESDTTEVT